MQNYDIIYRRVMCLLVVCTLSAISAGPAGAADEDAHRQGGSADVNRKSLHPYCGLYCVYTVLKLSGKQVDFKELVKPEYIGSRKGSSLAELSKAAKDHGLYAESATRMNSSMLRSAPYPVILHVKSNATAKEYDHFELFLGTENGKAKLFNPPEPIALVPFHELTPRWDGTGLIISAKPIDAKSVFAPAKRRYTMYAAAGLAIILGVHIAKRRWPNADISKNRRTLMGLSVAQAAGLAVAAILGGMIYHFGDEEGFLAHSGGVESIQLVHLSNFIPKISARQARHLVNNDAVFVDARFKKDFEAGHLEGAINIPVDANDTQRHKALADIGRDRRIVVYCQSAGCKFAEQVAVKLMQDGYSNISIFKAGWLRWEKENNG